MHDSDLHQQIVRAMRDVFPQHGAELNAYYGMMRYHLGWLDQQFTPTQANSGKLIRPMLVLLANRIYGGRDDQALPLAAGIQLLHDFSLIHDDIEDHSATRRGRATTWSIWGIAHAINAGDGMFTLAHRAMYQLSERDVPAHRVLSILQNFDETILRICEGQYLDMAAEGDLDVSVPSYLRMIRGKTAALAGASASLGARVATDDEAQIAAMWEFGEALGLAFQVQDDVLDIWGDPAQTGKPFAADLIQRKMSLPVIHSLAHVSAGDREQFHAIYRQPELAPADLETLLAILDRSESRSYAEELARSEYNRAMQALDRVLPTERPALADLRSLANTLLERTR